MKVLVLAAGTGSRLKPFTDKTCKPLVPVAGKPLVERALDSLVKSGLTEFVFCLGPFASDFKEWVRERFPSIKASFVENSFSSSTNYIYSMWLARRFLLGSELIVLHADLVMEEGVLEKLVNFKGENGVLVDESIAPPEKDFKARVEGGEVREIGVNVSGRGAFFCLPAYKLSVSAVNEWFKAIVSFISQDQKTVYAENALNPLLGNQIHLKPVYFGLSFGMEVDDMEDLKKAEAWFGGNGEN